MSSLLTPASWNDENENNNLISKKKAAHNKTQKRYPKEGFDSNKVNNLLKTINGDGEDDEDESSHLADFNPPPKPSSVGSDRAASNRDKAISEAMQNLGGLNNSSIPSLGNQPIPFLGNKNDEDLTLNNINQNYGDESSVEEFYKKFVPNYHKGLAQQHQQQHQQQQYQQPYKYSAAHNQPVFTGSSDDVLLQKLNYMIHLLEEKQDERTNNVTEEVVLYSFLGIFIIFIVDSFSRVGKYVR